MREGRGTQRQADGNTYIGEWKEGRLEGRGMWRFADGRVKVGCYKAGVDVGEGVGWTGDSDQAWRFHDGRQQDEIPQEEALRIATRLLGEPVDAWEGQGAGGRPTVPLTGLCA